MSTIDIKDQELEEEFEEYLEEESDDYEVSVEEAIQEVRDELTTHSELLEQLLSIYNEKLEQDKIFQNRLIETLEKLVNK